MRALARLVCALALWTGAGASSSTAYYTSVVSADGRIFAPPYDSTHVLMVVPSDQSETFFSETYAGGARYATCELANDGRIFCAPYNAPDVLVIDPTTNTSSVIGISAANGSTPVGDYARFISSAAAEDGRIFAYGCNTTSILLIDPVTNRATLTTSPQSAAHFNSTGGYCRFGDAVLAQNGKIYAPPRDFDRVLVTNPQTNHSYVLNGTVDGAYETAVVANDGRIFAAPSVGTKVLVISPDNGTFTYLSSAVTSPGYCTSVLASDGMIYAPPCQSSRVLVIDPATDTAHELDDLILPATSSLNFATCVEGDAGRLFCPPFEYPVAIVIDTAIGRVSNFTAMNTTAATYRTSQYTGGLIFGIPASGGLLSLDPANAPSVYPSGCVTLEGPSLTSVENGLDIDLDQVCEFPTSVIYSWSADGVELSETGPGLDLTPNQTVALLGGRSTPASVAFEACIFVEYRRACADLTVTFVSGSAPTISIHSEQPFLAGESNLVSADFGESLLRNLTLDEISSLSFSWTLARTARSTRAGGDVHWNCSTIVCSIDAKTLEPGENYELQLTADLSVTWYGAVFSTSLAFATEKTPVVATIYSGSGFEVGIGDTLLLDGQPSDDPSKTAGARKSYSWRCGIFNGQTGLYDNCVNFRGSYHEYLTLDTSTSNMGFEAGQLYKFTLTFTVTSNDRTLSRTDSISALVTIREFGIPAVHLSTKGEWRCGSLPTNAKMRLFADAWPSFSAISYQELSYAWSVDGQPLDIPASESYAEVLPSSLSTSSRISVTVTNAAFGTSATSYLDIVMYKAPVISNLSVVPVDFDARLYAFDATVSGSEVPFRYEYRCNRTVGDNFTLSSPSPVPDLVAMLPAGTVTVTLTAVDACGAIAKRSTGPIVTRVPVEGGGGGGCASVNAAVQEIRLIMNASRFGPPVANADVCNGLSQLLRQMYRTGDYVRFLRTSELAAAALLSISIPTAPANLSTTCPGLDLGTSNTCDATTFRSLTRSVFTALSGEVSEIQHSRDGIPVLQDQVASVLAKLVLPAAAVSSSVLVNIQDQAATMNVVIAADYDVTPERGELFARALDGTLTMAVALGLGQPGDPRPAACGVVDSLLSSISQLQLLSAKYLMPEQPGTEFVTGTFTAFARSMYSDIPNKLDAAYTSLALPQMLEHSRYSRNIQWITLASALFEPGACRDPPANLPYIASSPSFQIMSTTGTNIGPLPVGSSAVVGLPVGTQYVTSDSTVSGNATAAGYQVSDSSWQLAGCTITGTQTSPNGVVQAVASCGTLADEYLLLTDALAPPAPGPYQVQTNYAVLFFLFLYFALGVVSAAQLVRLLRAGVYDNLVVYIHALLLATCITRSIESLCFTALIKGFSVHDMGIAFVVVLAGLSFTFSLLCFLYVAFQWIAVLYTNNNNIPNKTPFHKVRKAYWLSTIGLLIIITVVNMIAVTNTGEVYRLIGILLLGIFSIVISSVTLYNGLSLANMMAIANEGRGKRFRKRVVAFCITYFAQGLSTFVTIFSDNDSVVGWSIAFFFLSELFVTGLFLRIYWGGVRKAILFAKQEPLQGAAADNFDADSVWIMELKDADNAGEGPPADPGIAEGDSPWERHVAREREDSIVMRRPSYERRMTIEVNSDEENNSAHPYFEHSVSSSAPRPGHGVQAVGSEGDVGDDLYARMSDSPRTGARI